VESSDFDLLAASLPADAGDVKTSVEALATKLAESFPGHVQIERKRALLSRAKRVRRISATLGDEQFDASSRDTFSNSLARSSIPRPAGLALQATAQSLEDEWPPVRRLRLGLP
jgi:hypothetical protein